jgi:ribose/xylose/arabinose/galactoside ABC-type transport system permease subunit
MVTQYFRQIWNNKYVLQQFVLLGILLVIMLFFYFQNPMFLHYTNLVGITRQASFVIIVGAGATLLMVSRHFDLSVGSLLALTGIVYAFLVQRGLPMTVAAIVTVLGGTLIGLMNGLTVVRLKIPAFIATLGTMYVVRGLTFLVTDAKSVRQGLPENFTFLGRGTMVGVPVVLLVILGVLAVFLFIEKRTLLGKYAIAIGGNRTAAELSGINVNSVVIQLYVLVGLLTGLAGVVMASRMGVGDPNVGVGFEFEVIIAVVLGGTSLAGGEGRILGMVVGALIVTFLSSGMNFMNLLSFYQDVMKGIVLALAVVLDQKLKARIT